MITTKFRRWSPCIALACFALGAIGCGGEGSIAVNKDKKGGLWGMRISSPAFKSDGTLDAKHTADGQNISPPLKWNAGPNGTVEYAIIVEDADAGGSKPAVHWLVYGIPKTVHDLPENAAATMRLAQGVNYLGQNGYAGPKSPHRSRHKYYFQIFALSDPIQLGPGATREELAEVYTGLVMSKGVKMVQYPGKK